MPRLFYPYDLDFIEDSMLMEVLQFSQGQPVYVPPNADFNPHVYMPLFFWLGAVLFKIGGPAWFYSGRSLLEQRLPRRS